MWGRSSVENSGVNYESEITNYELQITNYVVITHRGGDIELNCGLITNYVMIEQGDTAQTFVPGMFFVIRN